MSISYFISLAAVLSGSICSRRRNYFSLHYSRLSSSLRCVHFGVARVDVRLGLNFLDEKLNVLTAVRAVNRGRHLNAIILLGLALVGTLIFTLIPVAHILLPVFDVFGHARVQRAQANRWQQALVLAIRHARRFRHGALGLSHERDVRSASVRCRGVLRLANGSGSSSCDEALLVGRYSSDGRGDGKGLRVSVGGLR